MERSIGSIFLADNDVLLRTNDVHFPCLSPLPEIIVTLLTREREMIHQVVKYMFPKPEVTYFSRHHLTWRSVFLQP